MATHTATRAAQWFAVYQTEDGRLVSICTVVADLLPSGLEKKEIRAPQEAGTEWDSESLSFVPSPPSPPDVDRVEEFVGRLARIDATEIRNKLTVLLGDYRWRAVTDDYKIGAA